VKAWSGKNRQNQYSEVLLPDENGVPGFKTQGVRSGECYLHVILSMTSWDDQGTANPQSIKLYAYPPNNELYCSFAAVKDFDTLYPLYGPLLEQITGSNDRGKHRTLWALLEHKLDDVIRQAHRQGAFPVMNFKDMYEFLLKDNPLSESHAHRLRRLLNKHWDDRDHIKLNNGEAMTDDWRRGRGAFEALCALENDAFLKVVNIMHPNESSEDYNVNAQGLKNVVYEGLEKIELPIGVDSMQYQAKKPYVLTALAEGNEMLDSYAEDITRQMASNPNITAQLFTDSVIINLSIEGSFHELLKKNNQRDIVHDPGVVGGVSSEHIRDPADLQFIKLETAIAEINPREGQS
jgi:hypothetical protein